MSSALPARALARVITGPLGFLISGLIDVAIAARLAAVYVWRSTIRSRWQSGKES